MGNVIEIINLKKKYDNQFRLEEINLSIPTGRVIGLIGENGAGKTTLIKSLLNITISNWELEETSPNPEQLKLLSKVLNVSIDELLDNNIKNVIVQRISNTQKLAGIIIKILKFIGILFIILLIIDLITFILFSSTGKLISLTSSATTICKIKENKYEIEFDTDKHFVCDNCSDKMSDEIKKLVDFNDISYSIKNIENYFESKSGVCE